MVLCKVQLPLAPSDGPHIAIFLAEKAMLQSKVPMCSKKAIQKDPETSNSSTYFDFLCQVGQVLLRLQAFYAFGVGGIVTIFGTSVPFVHPNINMKPIILDPWASMVHNTPELYNET